jgi:hypothetical protein
MCKFDKNQSYSTRTVFEALNNKFPEEKEETLFPLIGQRFTALKLVPVNKQKKNRFFSGTDCQTVFDYYDKKFCKKYGIPYKKEKDKQITIEEAIKPKRERRGVQTTIENEDVAKAIDYHAKAIGVSRSGLVTDILKTWIEENPVEDLDFKTSKLETREDWLNFIRENYEKGE